MSSNPKRTKLSNNLSPLNSPNVSDKNTYLRFEKIPTLIYEDSVSASKSVANEVASIIKIKQLRNENCLIGFATGSTMVAFYEELVRLHKKEKHPL